MNRRWQSVRERLREGVLLPRQPAAWDRVVESRARGDGVALPARDPQVRTGVVLALLGAGAIALGVIQVRPPATSTVAAAAHGDVDAWSWLVPPAYAQAAVASSLPPIDRLHLERIRPGRWVYSRHSGVDGIVTSDINLDTVRVTRDAAEGGARLVAVRVVPHRRLVDSLVAFNDGPTVRLVTSTRHYRDSTRFARIEADPRPDTLRLLGYASNGTAARIHEIPASWAVVVEDLLPALLPAVALNEHFARALNMLDLLGGQTRNAGRPYELRVVGRETVRTPAGLFDCWVVELKALAPNRALTHRLKVARESGVLVQARWDEWNGFFREQELVAYE